MKQHILPAIKLTALTLLFFAVMFPLTIWSIAKFAPNSGKGDFWSRPSAVNYNASGSGASNKGPSNKEYLKEVQARIDTFLIHNPEISTSEIPVDLITASGSGLDPNISVQAAKVQIKRIANITK